MRIMLHSFVVSLVLLLGIASLWRPASGIFTFEPVDWAVLYEKQHTPTHGFGSSSYAMEILRTSEQHHSLTAFIQESIGQQGVLTDKKEWLDWQKQHFPASGAAWEKTVYMAPDDPLALDIRNDRGYITMNDSNLATFTYTRLEPENLGGKNIPAAIRFPYRTTAGIMILAGCFLSFLLPGTDKKALQTSSGIGTRFFLFIFSGGLVVTGLPFLYGWTGSEQFGVIFLGAFIILFGVIGILLFGLETVKVHGLLQGRDMLAHWTISDREWQEFNKWSYQEGKSIAFAGLILVTVIAVVIAGGFLSAVRDEGAVIAAAVVGAVILFLWLMVGITLMLRKRKARSESAEVYISLTQVYVNGTVASWFLPGSRLESITLQTEPVPAITLITSAIMMAGKFLYFFRQNSTCFIPVPASKLQEAKKIIAQLQPENKV